MHRLNACWNNVADVLTGITRFHYTKVSNDSAEWELMEWMWCRFCSTCWH